LEYQRRRLGVIRDEKHIFIKIDQILKKIETVFESDFKELSLGKRFPALNSKTDKLNSDVKKLINSYKKSVNYLDKNQPCVRSHDPIRDQLNQIFENKIGNIPENQEFLDKIFKEGEERYKTKTPPGYDDDGKSKQEDNVFMFSGLKYERRYGDLIIWKQIIEKSSDENVNSVILVTDDAKDDWWYILDSRGKKQIGPRAELREEICKKSNINLFTMYNTADFLESGKEILNVDVSDESITDAGRKFVDNIITNSTSPDITYGNMKAVIDALKSSGAGAVTLSNAYKEILKKQDIYKTISTNKDYENIMRALNTSSYDSLLNSWATDLAWKDNILKSLNISQAQQWVDLLKTNKINRRLDSENTDESESDED